MILVNVFVSLAVTCSAVLGSPVYTSSVYVKSGPDVVPLEYVEYTPSYSVPKAQLAQLSASPIGSVVGYSSPVSYQGLVPCVTPCVYDVATVPQLPAQNAKIVAYQSAPLPKVSLGYVPKDGSRGYEYSYMVYDEGTGDQKAQRETSDGSVVRGQYSLLQPDGYVREVQYSAGDDGFNAVVKNIRPVSNDKKADMREEIKENPKNETEVTTAEPNEPKKTETSQEIVEVITTETATEAVTQPPTNNRIYLTFQDLVRCAQAASKKSDDKPTTETTEVNVDATNVIPNKALTYIVIPSLNGPC